MQSRIIAGIDLGSGAFAFVTCARSALVLLLISCGGSAHAQSVSKTPALPLSSTPKVIPTQALISSGHDKLTLSRARFSDLPGWRKDRHANALPAFLASCKKLKSMDRNAQVGTGPFGGKAKDWLRACRLARRVPSGDHAKARVFFEKQFKAYATRGKTGTRGKITGYYVQPLRASLTRKGRYQFPLYRRPADLVSVSLSDFVGDGRSRRIWGRMNDKGSKLIPYPTRLELRQARAQTPSPNDDHVLVWVDDPADAIQVEIEGSGRALLDDGSTIMVAFAGKNGRKSGKLGSIARAMRSLSKAHGSGAWSKEEIARYQEIADQKTSIVFFKSDQRTGAIGSQNVVLTPQRSLAVDRAVISLSTPVWVDTRAPSSPRGRIAPYQHLLIAQDTGGAIIGTMRGDIYWGLDRSAVAMGRRVNNPGRMWLLLPRSIKVRTSSIESRR